MSNFGFDRVLPALILLSAITLALAYRPILTGLSFGLVTPYAKADLNKRLFAATVDILLVATALAFYLQSRVVYIVSGTAYLLFRDALHGRSIGKFVFGLVVINLEKARPCSFASSVRRNILFVLPGANVVAVFLEALTTIRDPQGQRLGDRLALTQVIEGFGARDVVAAVQKWWLDFIAQLDASSVTADREPERVPR